MPRHLSTFQSTKKSEASKIPDSTNIRTVSLETKLIDSSLACLEGGMINVGP